jgi:translation elongation factor EF-4
VLQRIIEEIPHPNVGNKDDKLKLFLLNSWFISGKNVICLFYVMSGTLKKGISIVSCNFDKQYNIYEVGILHP